MSVRDKRFLQSYIVKENPNGVLNGIAGQEAHLIDNSKSWKCLGGTKWVVSTIAVSSTDIRSYSKRSFNSISDMISCDDFYEGEAVSVASYHEGKGVGGGNFIAKSTDLSKYYVPNGVGFSASVTPASLVIGDTVSFSFMIPKDFTTELVVIDICDDVSVSFRTNNDGNTYYLVFKSFVSITKQDGSQIYDKKLTLGEVYKANILIDSNSYAQVSTLTVSSSGEAVYYNFDYNITNIGNGSISFSDHIGQTSINGGSHTFTIDTGDVDSVWRPYTMDTDTFRVFRSGNAYMERVIENNQVTPQMFGAISNNTPFEYANACHDEIQAAFDSIYNVYIPAGNYYIRKPITIRTPQEVTLVGVMADDYSSLRYLGENKASVIYSNLNIDHVIVSSKDVKYSNGIIYTGGVNRNSSDTEDIVGHTKAGFKIDLYGKVWGLYVDDLHIIGNKDKLVYSGIGTKGVHINSDEFLGTQIGFVQTVNSSNSITLNELFTEVNVNDVIYSKESLIGTVDTINGTTITFKADFANPISGGDFINELVVGDAYLSHAFFNGGRIEACAYGIYNPPKNRVLNPDIFIWGNNVFFWTPMRKCKTYIYSRDGGVAAINYKGFFQDAAIMGEEDYKSDMYVVDSNTQLIFDGRAGDYTTNTDDAELGLYRHDSKYLKLEGDTKILDGKVQSLIGTYSKVRQTNDSSLIYNPKNFYVLDNGYKFISQLENQIAHIGEVVDAVTYKGYKVTPPTEISPINNASAKSKEEVDLISGDPTGTGEIHEANATTSWVSVDVNNTITSESADPYPDGGAYHIRVTANIDDTQTHARLPIPVEIGKKYNLEFVVRGSGVKSAGWLTVDGFDEIDLNTPISGEHWREYKYSTVTASLTGDAYINVYLNYDSKISSNKAMIGQDYKLSTSAGDEEVNRYFTLNHTDFASVTEIRFNEINGNGYNKKDDGYFDSLINQISTTNDLRIEIAREVNDGNYGLYDVSAISYTEYAAGQYYATFTVSAVVGYASGSIGVTDDRYTMFDNPQLRNSIFLNTYAAVGGDYEFEINPNGYTPVSVTVEGISSPNSDNNNYDLTKDIRDAFLLVDPNITVSDSPTYSRIGFSVDAGYFNTIMRGNVRKLGNSGDYVDIDAISCEERWWDNNLLPADDPLNTTLGGLTLSEDNVEGAVITNTNLLKKRASSNINKHVLKSLWGMAEVVIKPFNNEFFSELYLDLFGCNAKYVQVLASNSTGTGGIYGKFNYSNNYNNNLHKIPIPAVSPTEFIIIRFIGNSTLNLNQETIINDIAAETQDMRNYPFLPSIGGTVRKDLGVLGSIDLTGQLNKKTFDTAPSSASDTGIKGEVRITSTYIYVCTATNTWVRTPLTTW